MMRPPTGKNIQIADVGGGGSTLLF
jgi:hypothetical protein